MGTSFIAIFSREGSEARKQARGCWASASGPTKERRERGRWLGLAARPLVLIS